jgi:hypothetical protein
MKRGLALGAVLCLAATASPVDAATAPTTVKISSWKVVTGKGTSTAQPGTTYKHCPSNPVMRLVVIGKMSHPGKKGVHYSVVWKRNDTVVASQDYKTGKHGKVRARLLGGGAPLEDGTWRVLIIRQGQPVGESKLKVKSSNSAC